jgi:hypothetical protein
VELEELQTLRQELQRSLNRVDKLITGLTEGPVEKKVRVPRAEVEEVFNYWVEKVKKGRKGVKLTPERERKIIKAIEVYDQETAFLAIDGVLLSSFHMGDNNEGKQYNDIELILRNGVNIEKFRDLALEDASPAADFINDDWGAAYERDPF